MFVWDKSNRMVPKTKGILSLMIKELILKCLQLLSSFLMFISYCVLYIIINIYIVNNIELKTIAVRFVTLLVLCMCRLLVMCQLSVDSDIPMSYEYDQFGKTVFCHPVRYSSSGFCVCFTQVQFVLQINKKN